MIPVRVATPRGVGSGELAQGSQTQDFWAQGFRAQAEVMRDLARYR